MTNLEYDALLNLQKVFVDKKIVLPQEGTRKTFKLNSIDTKDQFFFDINRSGSISLSKVTMQTRYKPTRLPLIRLDIGGPPHTNPDGVKLSRRHVHIYRGNDDEFSENLPWAIELEDFIKEFDKYGFDSNTKSFMDLLYMFCGFCNIDSSLIQGVL